MMAELYRQAGSSRARRVRGPPERHLNQSRERRYWGTNETVTDAFEVRLVSEAELGPFFSVGEQAFNSTRPAQLARDQELVTLELPRSLAAFDNGRPVGTATAYSFLMTVPGGRLPTAGVSAVAVLPDYRRRGIMSALMRRQLADIRAAGESVAALFASEPGIYGRFGYGCATAALRFTVRRGEGVLQPARWAPAGDGHKLRVRGAVPAESRPELAAVYEAVAPQRPGMMARDDRWWTSVLADPPWSRHGSGPVRAVVAEDDGGPRGYALYHTQTEWGEDALPSGTLTVSELLAADPGATAALWADLLSRDLISEVRASQRPEDDPLLQLLTDRRRARTRRADGLWIRLADVPAALTQRRYSCAVDVVIEVTDELIGSNSGRWRLRASGRGDFPAAACERVTAAADIALGVQALGAAYLGGVRLGALAAAGQVAELQAGALAGLSTAMSWDPAPWCTSIF